MESEADRVSSAIVLEIILSKTVYSLKLSLSLNFLDVRKQILLFFRFIGRKKKKLAGRVFFTHIPRWGKMWRSSEQVRRGYSQVSAHSF